jgi:hypothetical protein
VSEPLREQALVALVARLQAMTGLRFWGSPYSNPIRVERKLAMPQTVTQFPHLCVLEGSLDGTGSTVAIEVTAGTQVGMRHEFKLLLAGYVSADPVTVASTWLQRLWADCLLTLMAENTLGGLVQAIQWVPDMETDEGSLDPIAAFVQPLVVIFHETFTTD